MRVRVLPGVPPALCAWETLARFSSDFDSAPEVILAPDDQLQLPHPSSRENFWARTGLCAESFLLRPVGPVGPVGPVMGWSEGFHKRNSRQEFLRRRLFAGGLVSMLG